MRSFRTLCDLRGQKVEVSAPYATSRWQPSKNESFRTLPTRRTPKKKISPPYATSRWQTKNEIFRNLCDLRVANKKQWKFSAPYATSRWQTEKKKASAPYATSGWQAAPKLEVFRPYATSGWQPNIMRSQRAKSGSFPTLCDLRVANKK